MKRRAHPQQAGFVRRFFAFSCDTVLAAFLSLAVFFAYNETAARLGGRTGELSRLARALEEGASARILIRGTSLSLSFEVPEGAEAEFRTAFVQELRKRLTEEEFAKASGLSLAELEKAYPQVMDRFPGGRAKVYLFGGEDLSVIYEFICGYAYFILFFRFGGRTVGKRLFGLQVIDLGGRSRLGWYQAFERTHGYAASTLAAFLGFLQVLWDHGGQTMHDRLAGTTVVRRRMRRPARERVKDAVP